VSLVERVAPRLAAGSSVRFGSVKSDAAQVIRIYQRHAQAYSRDRDDRLIEQRWLDRFVALLPSQRRTVLDIGCGTGAPIIRYLIEQRCQAQEVDSSGKMIATCVDRFPQQQWHIADTSDH
jgi:ubiquinone/menaquinone biosynthesis C-methylase UbiE